MPLPLPLPPTQQAVHSQTFVPPPIDGSISAPQMVDHHMTHNPAHPLFRYKSTNASDSSFEELLWGDVSRAIHRAARLVHAHVGISSKPDASSIIATLSNADIPTYFAFAHGILRAGCQVFFISPRNSPAAVAHLLAETSASCLVVGQDQCLRDLASSALETLSNTQLSSPPKTLEFPAFRELYLMTMLISNRFLR